MYLAWNHIKRDAICNEEVFFIKPDESVIKRQIIGHCETVMISHNCNKAVVKFNTFGKEGNVIRIEVVKYSSLIFNNLSNEEFVSKS